MFETFKFHTFKLQSDSPYLPIVPKMGKYASVYRENGWIDKGYKRYRINNMNTSYLLNCIKMIEKICRKNDLNVNNYSVYENLKYEYEKRIR